MVPIQVRNDHVVMGSCPSPLTTVSDRFIISEAASSTIETAMQMIVVHIECFLSRLFSATILSMSSIWESVYTKVSKTFENPKIIHNFARFYTEGALASCKWLR